MLNALNPKNKASMNIFRALGNEACQDGCGVYFLVVPIGGTILLRPYCVVWRFHLYAHVELACIFRMVSDGKQGPDSDQMRMSKS